MVVVHVRVNENISLISVFLFCVLLVGCFASSENYSDVDGGSSYSHSDEEDTSFKEPLKISVVSIIPEKFSPASSIKKRFEQIIFPVEFFDESEIVRPRAELRSGPGVQFPLKEDVLTKGTKVILFERLGVWQKVLAYEGKGDRISGWVHYQTIKDSYKSQLEMTISVRDLPSLVVARKISKVYTNPSFDLKKVEIPRGKVFNWLCRRNKKYLIWIAETNSVAWLLEEDVR